MNKQLRSITIKDGRVYFIWDHTDTTSSGATVKTGGETQYSRGINATEPGLAAWLSEAETHAANVLAYEDQRTATAEAAAEAARLAELARWNALTPEEQAAEILANNPPPEPPSEISRKQALVWFIEHGTKPETIEAWLKDAKNIEDEKQRDLALLAYSSDPWLRSEPWLVAYARAIDIDLEKMFREAAVL